MYFRLVTIFTGKKLLFFNKGLSHQHMFVIISLIYSGVFGSGLCVFSKHPIVTTLFHSWSVNGYVHRIQHGDWFGGKGVGLCQILMNGFPINIYIAHVSKINDSVSNEQK